MSIEESHHHHHRRRVGGHYLSRTECAALRGLAIIGIFMHNYCHWLKGIVRENEYTFDLANAKNLQEAMLSLDANMPIHLLSFFGHYGVPLFLFLSGYGLVLKYERNPKEPKKEMMWFKHVRAFIGSHFGKLFRMMIIGFVAFLIVDRLTPGHRPYPVLNVVAQLGMFNNLLPNPDQVIWPGPYWFFGLMLQLYILYRMAIYRRHWIVIVLLMVVCCAIQMVCPPTGNTLNWLRYNFMGSMLPFGLGLIVGRYEYRFKHLHTVVYVWGCVLSCVAAYMMSMNFWTWFWAPVFVITGSVCLVKMLPRWIGKGLGWMGGISAALFVIHPVLRKIFIPISHHGDLYGGLLLYVVTSICVAWLFKQLLDHVQHASSDKQQESIGR